MANGDYVVRAQNLCAATMTAGLAVAVASQARSGRPMERSVRVFDSVISYPMQPSVGHDQVYTFVFWPSAPIRKADGTPIPVEKQAELKAALFSDGSTWGDPQGVARLLRARNEYLQLTNLLLSETRDAMQSSTPASQFIAKVRAENKSREAAAREPLDKQVVEKVYGEFLADLQSCTVTQGRSGADCLRQESGLVLSNKARLATSRPKLEGGLPPAP